MNKQILIGNTFENYGKKLAADLSHFGFDTEYTTNDPVPVLKKMESVNYDGVIFFLFNISEKPFLFLEKCRNMYPDTKIYPLISDYTAEKSKKLCNAGAKRCIPYPCSHFNICDNIIGDFFTSDEIIIFPEIADFISSKGFPSRKIGFYFLCCAVELTVNNPQIISRITKTLYPAVALKMNTTPQNVERSIRVECLDAFRKGCIQNDEIFCKKPGNKELIISLAREYSDKIGL